MGKSAGGVGVIGGFEDGLGSVNDTEINDGVNIDGNVVTSDDFLFGNVHWGGTDIDFGHMVNVGDNDVKAGFEHS